MATQTSCCVTLLIVDEARDVPDVGVVGGLLIPVVQDVHYLHTSVHPNVEWCDGTLLITCCWCVDIEVM